MATTNKFNFRQNVGKPKDDLNFFDKKAGITLIKTTKHPSFFKSGFGADVQTRAELCKDGELILYSQRESFQGSKAVG